MERRLKKAILNDLEGRPFETRRALIIEGHGCETTVREFRTEHVPEKHNDFNLEEIGSHVARTLVFRKGKNGRLYPVKKKGS